MVDQNELLPCPFCGGCIVSLLLPTCRPETPYNAADRLYPVVRCSQCHTEVPGNNEDYKGRSAIIAWNKRAAPSVSDRSGSGASRVSSENPLYLPPASQGVEGEQSLEEKEAVSDNVKAVLQKALSVSWACRVHPTNWWHEVGCPHCDWWTKEQLWEALITAKQSHAMLLKQTYGASSVVLDGEIGDASGFPKQTSSSPTSDSIEAVKEDKT